MLVISLKKQVMLWSAMSNILHRNTFFKTLNLEKMFQTSIYPIIKTYMQEFEYGPSGQSLESILHLKIEIIKLNPMRAG